MHLRGVLGFLALIIRDFSRNFVDHFAVMLAVSTVCRVVYFELLVVSIAVMVRTVNTCLRADVFAITGAVFGCAVPAGVVLILAAFGCVTKTLALIAPD